MSLRLDLSSVFVAFPSHIRLSVLTQSLSDLSV